MQPLAAFKSSVVEGVEPMPGDASRRQFARVFFSQGKISRAILVTHPVMPDARAPESAERSFVELGRYFRERGIAVPFIYHWFQDSHAILVEDVGNLGLWRFAENRVPPEGEVVKDILGDSWKQLLFEKAMAVIKQLQSLPHDRNSRAFQRGLTFERYRSDAQEFLDYYAIPRNLKPSEQGALKKIFDGLCETIMSFPQALSHFDFTAHNLFVSAEGDIRVLDFQDAQLASPARDIVSLINDRGMDETVGASLHSRLLSRYQEIMATGPEFAEQYDLTLLHWDFRVTGRFHKLTETLKTDKYMQWVPGTLRRLGRTLKRSYRRIHGMESALEILERFSAEVREGMG